MDWQERRALETQADEWAANATDEDRHKALEAYKQLAAATEGEYSHSTYLEKIQDVEMDLMLGDEIDPNTQLAITMIEEVELPKGIVWSEVDMIRVLRTLTRQNTPYGIGLYGEIATLVLEMTNEMLRQKPEWYPRYLKHISPNFFSSCYGGPMWSLRLMWHGGVLVRNYHRVQGFNYVGIVRVENMDEVVADLEKIREAIPTLIEEEDQRYYYLWMLNAVGDEVVSDLDFSRLNRSGNCLIGISSTDALAACDVLTPELLGSTIESGRGGVALRIFEGGFMVLDTGRWEDALDFCTNNMWIGSYDGVDPEGVTNVHVQLPEISQNPPSDPSVSREERQLLREARQQKTKDFYRGKVQALWDDEVAYALEQMDDEVRQRLERAGEASESEGSALDLLFERTLESMTGNGSESGTFTKCAAQCRPIFAGAADQTAGYGSVSLSGEGAEAWQKDPTNPVSIKVGLPWNCTSLSEILPMADPSALVELAATHGFATDSAVVEVLLPTLGEEEDPWRLNEEWRPMNRESLQAFLTRLCAWLTCDEDEPGSLKTRLDLYAGASISDEGSWVPAEGDAADLIVPEDSWECASEMASVGHEFIRVRCDLPKNQLIGPYASVDLAEMGKGISGALDEGVCTEAGEPLTVGSRIIVDLDPFGLSQGFDCGDMDSGNLEDWG